MEARFVKRKAQHESRGLSFPHHDGTLGSDELRKMDAYWRAANYLSVGQIYLYGNPLLREPLTLAHVKPPVVGHWGTVPGQNFIYVHLNRVIKKYDLNMLSSPVPVTAERRW
jgi:xylulose-5-phosphate/fructose-6-phosphate phosphoketolase